MSGKIQRFEYLIAWQKARALTKLIYQVTRGGVFSKDFGLRDQIQRAAVSVMSNLAEGFERGSTAEFHQFVVISKALCAEVRSQLYAAFDIGYLSENQFKQTQALAGEVSRIIGGLRASLQRKRQQRNDSPLHSLIAQHGSFSALPFTLGTMVKNRRLQLCH